MAFSFDALPKGVMLRIAEKLNTGDVSALAQTSKSRYQQLWPVQYQREVEDPRPVGFIRAVQANSFGAATKFIKTKADVNVQVDIDGDHEDFDGPTTPLAAAVAKGHEEMVGLLLRHKADVDARIDGTLSETLLANPHHPWAGVDNHTPLSMAIALGHDDIAAKLLEEMSDPNPIVTVKYSGPITALEQAAVCLRPKIVRLLLERGADPNKTDRHLVGGRGLIDTLGDESHRKYVSSIPNGNDLYKEVVVLLVWHSFDPFKSAFRTTKVNSMLRDCDGN